MARTASATGARETNSAAPPECVSCCLFVVVDSGALDVEVALLELLADGQPTPLYVARMIFAACSARPYVGAWS